MTLSARSFAVSACCAGVLLTGCGGDDGTTTLRIDGLDTDYDRDVYEVGPGPVTLEFRNVGVKGHNIVFRDAPDAPVIRGSGKRGTAGKALAAGQSETFELELVEGEFEFYCSVIGHERQGMVATLVVR